MTPQCLQLLHQLAHPLERQDCRQRCLSPCASVLPGGVRVGGLLRALLWTEHTHGTLGLVCPARNSRWTAAYPLAAGDSCTFSWASPSLALPWPQAAWPRALLATCGGMGPTPLSSFLQAPTSPTMRGRCSPTQLLQQIPGWSGELSRHAWRTCCTGQQVTTIM